MLNAASSNNLLSITEAEKLKDEENRENGRARSEYGDNENRVLSPTSGGTRSRRSHRLKSNSVEMVDRSQQDSRCS